MEFALGGAAAVAAGFFTNPLEVLKTRMQLQGELKARGHHAVHYRNVFHAAYVVAKNDGLLALQKGLVATAWVQMIMNGMRLGTYGFAESKGWLTDKEGRLVLYKCALISGTGGVVGHLMANPFFMIKTHLQAQATKGIAVGHQHDHESLTHAFRSIYKKEGIKGLFRGTTAVVPRAFVASTAQLTSFQFAKEYLKTYEGLQDMRFTMSFLAGMIGGVSISIMVTPFDLVMTRLYNQPVDARGRGVHYNGYIDCISKIYRSEGIYAFYKGLGPMYFRLGPHTLLCLMFWDLFKQLYEQYGGYSGYSGH